MSFLNQVLSFYNLHPEIRVPTYLNISGITEMLGQIPRGCEYCLNCPAEGFRDTQLILYGLMNLAEFQEESPLTLEEKSNLFYALEETPEGKERLELFKNEKTIRKCISF